MGSKSLFDGLSFGVHENERIALIGPNGAGKSTLIKLIMGQDTPDSGEVICRRNVTLAYVPQENDFNESKTAFEVVRDSLQDSHFSPSDCDVQAATQLTVVGLDDIHTPIQKLSGGWRKRVSIAMALARLPDGLILDEPTNHLDWDGILWLENWLRTFRGALIIVSHDRVFLEKTTERTIEINPAFPGGNLSFELRYSAYLERRDEFLSQQREFQQRLANKVRRETAWLRAGVKARTTKSVSRMEKAHALIDQLAELKSRNARTEYRHQIELESGGRQTKRLIETENLEIGYNQNVLLQNVQIKIGPGQTWGILGHNGSGKTTLLKTLAREIEPLKGFVDWADKLQIIHFDQKREQLPMDLSLRQYLGDGSDQIVFRGKAINAAAYASRFGFQSEKMNLRINQLSGGERARLLIAKLFLQPTDVLILDEPTNDLDIETIEILENMISEFPGAVLVVSHDRAFLSNTCTHFLGIHRDKSWALYADVYQWLDHEPPAEGEQVRPKTSANDSAPKQTSRGLKYKEKRQLETIEDDIQKAEALVKDLETQLALPVNVADHKKMKELTLNYQNATQRVEDLYRIWSELDAKTR